MKTMFTVAEVLISTRHTHTTKRECRGGRHGWFDTLGQAEAAMRRIVKDAPCRKGFRTYGFIINEKPVGIVYSDELCNERLYGPDGTLVEASLFARGYGYGHLPKEVRHRFRIGDMVEYIDLRHSEINLAIVAREPLQPSEWFGKVHELDNYVLLPLGSTKYYYVPSIRVMSPHVPVSDAVRKAHEDYLADAPSKGLYFNEELS